MTRKALIIGNSGDKNNYLEGVQQDVENYKQFLLSKIGGRWYENEIVVSLGETKIQIENKIATLKNGGYDFVFILFSGHGSYSSSKECRKLYIFDDSIYEDELTYLAPKQITILDVCAGIEHELLTESMEALDQHLIFKAMLIDYRKKYENAILGCPEQQVVLYSSSINENSNDSELGGHFVYNLLRVAQVNKQDILSSREAYLSAKEIVQYKTKRTQNPSAQFIKIGNVLPFSLGVK
jgi:hypothetical protein